MALTLKQYAKAKRLPVKILQKYGVGEVYLQGIPAVRMPYLDANGVVRSTRMRVSMDDEPRFIWKTGSKLCLYGLWRLQKIKSQYLCIVEGESDCHSLWLNGFPALGLPGAGTWKEEWAPHLDAFERVYVVVEPDKGGESVLNWVSNSKIRDRVRLITLDGTKDPSGLYLSDPEDFTRAWKAAMKSAVPWSERENAENRKKKKVAWKECKRLAQIDDILKEFSEALEKQGMAGERKADKIIFLALISRFLSRPVSLVVTAPSSAGKSFTVEQILGFFPPSAYYALTAMSERALAYSSEPLSHRFLVLYEGAALNV